MTLRNMCAKVTPKPLNEPVKVPTSHLLLCGLAADRGGCPFGDRTPGTRARRYLEVHRGDRETARWTGGQLFLDGELTGLAGGRPEHGDQQDHDDGGADHQPP